MLASGTAIVIDVSLTPHNFLRIIVDNQWLNQVCQGLTDGSHSIETIEGETGERVHAAAPCSTSRDRSGDS